MKKRNLVISAFTMALFTVVQAQKLSFCEALPMLEKNATEEFVDIRKEVDNSVKYPTTYLSSIQILEATSSRIVKSSDGFKFKADFGTFSSKDEARKKMNEVVAALKNCHKGLNTTFSTDVLSISEYHTIYVANSEGLRLYSAKFNLRTLGNKSDLFFEFDASQKRSSLFGNATKAYYDYAFVKEKLTNDEFCIALRKVIEEANTGFKAIKGAETDYGRGFTCYRTKYFIPGYSSFIEDRTLGIVFYVVPTFQRANAQNFATIAEKTQKMIQSALGSNYAYRTSEDGKAQIYVHKNKPDKKVVELVLKDKEDESVFELYISNLE